MTEPSRTGPHEPGVLIWHQSMTEAGGAERYRDGLRAHACSVCGPGVRVHVHHLPDGSYHGHAPTDVLHLGHVSHAVSRPLIEFAIDAEATGYDAFVIGSYSEPLVRELRCAVDIPVVGVGESTLLTALTLGRYPGLVTNAPSISSIVDRHVDEWGLRSRVRGVRHLREALNEPALLACYEDPARAVDAFEVVARELVEAGADVLIPAEGILSELLHQAGLTHVAGAPVLDSFGLAWHHAVMLAGLWRHAGLRVSRRGEYAGAPPSVTDTFYPSTRRAKGRPVRNER